MVLLRDLRLPIFRDINTKVIPAALRLIKDQYQLTRYYQLKPYTKTFTITLGLPYGFKMEERIVTGAGVLKIEDIYSHWRFEKSLAANRPSTETSTENHNVSKVDVSQILEINEPAVIKPKGRPPGDRGKRRTAAQRAFDNSTRRGASGFEYSQRPEALATTASQVAEQEERAQADAFFGAPSLPGPLAQSPRRRGGRSRAVTARGGSTHGGRGRGRSGYTSAAGAAGGGVATPAYATGALAYVLSMLSQELGREKSSVCKDCVFERFGMRWIDKIHGILSDSKKKILAIWRSSLGKLSTWFLANVDLLALHICAPVPWSCPRSLSLGNAPGGILAALSLI